MTAEATAPALTQPIAPNFGLTKFLDPLPTPPVLRPHSWWHRDEITVTTARAEVQLHSQLPPTEVWTYNGTMPGPTFDVHRDRTLRVSWTNGIDAGTYPLLAVQVPIAANPSASPGFRNPDGSLPPGVSIIDGVADLPAWNVTHLHGSATDGGDDGWAHNAVLAGHSQLAEYQNHQQSTTLWYHDHAMAITRLNVHTGLAGMYLIRDEQEDRLGLPSGPYELPLVVTDRNLDVDVSTGRLTGQLLYKVAVVPGGAMVAFSGPFTVVNGVIWPHKEVEPRWYRFRVLNASNSRFYTFNLIDPETGENHNDAIRQIGTDSGLLPVPTPLPAKGLTMAPAERSDLLIDFSAFRGRSLVLTNTDPAKAPEPDVMEFRVRDRSGHDSFTLPETVSSTYYRVVHGSTLPADHEHVWVALVSPGTAGDGHPQMWELTEITDPAASATQQGIIQVLDPATKKVRTFQRVAKAFDDATSIFLDHGRWAVWNILNIGTTPGITHPIHIHLTEFQALSRNLLDSTGFDPAVGGTKPGAPITVSGPGVLDANEEGWKDTIRVGVNEWVSVAGQFVEGTGAFMYHCHILDHEDDGMMRPFVVQPAAVNAMMGTGMSMPMQAS